MKPVETTHERGVVEGRIQVWYSQYIVRTFVNATMYPYPAQQQKKKMKYNSLLVRKKSNAIWLSKEKMKGPGCSSVWTQLTEENFQTHYPERHSKLLPHIYSAGQAIVTYAYNPKL
jgi:hypothetical protein